MDSVHNSIHNSIELQDYQGIYLTTNRVLATHPEKDQQSYRAPVSSADANSAAGSDEEELNPQIETFKDDIEYYLCCCGYFIGFGNVLVFPHLIFDNGGAAFLIPYTLSLFLIVIPLFTLETAWGQLIRTKLPQKFSIVQHRLWGVPLAMVAIIGMTLMYYAILFPWTLSFFIDSFRRPLPWESDEGLWNKKYFQEDMLERSESIESPIRIVPRLFMYLIFSYFLIYFTVQKGLQTSSQVVYFTVPVPCFLLAILLIKGVTLEGSEVGLYYLFVPEWEKLKDLQIWEKALTQALFQTGLVYGPILLYATARKPESKVITSSILLPLLDYVLSLLSGMSLFAFLGHVAHTEDLEIEELSTGGLDLAFIAYPGLMTTLSFSNFWSIMFFLMLLLIGIDTVFGMFDFIIAYCWDFFHLKNKMKKQVLVLIICGFICSCNVLFVTNSGWWFYALFSKHVGSFSLIFVLLAETYVIAFAFGFDRLDAVMYKKTGERIPWIYKILIKYFATPAMTLILLHSIYIEFTTSGDPLWAKNIGRVIIALPIIATLLGFCVQVKTPSVEALVEKQFGKPLDHFLKYYEKQKARGFPRRRRKKSKKRGDRS